MKRPHLFAIVLLAITIIAFAGCSAQSPSSAPSRQPQSQSGVSPSSDATPESPASTAGDASSGADGTMTVKVTAGDRTFEATLEDNASARELWSMLPLTLPMRNLYSREMCYRLGAGALPADEAAEQGYSVGDISYWPPAGSLVILYEQNGEVFERQPLGHTDADVSFFAGTGDMDVTFERAG